MELMETDPITSISFEVKHFQELTPIELYSCFKLRYDVFVVEQQCIYDEFDNHDQDAHFVLARSKGDIVGLARIALIDEKIHIGRVVVTPAFRKLGIARALMEVAMEYIEKHRKHQDIYVSAQEYLKSFYASLGFKQTGAPYDWDGIIHVDMYLCAK